MNEEIKKQTCKNCGKMIDMPYESVEDKLTELQQLTIIDVGRSVYKLVNDGKLRSIDLCNFCYSVMRAYKNSLCEHPINALDHKAQQFIDSLEEA